MGWPKAWHLCQVPMCKKPVIGGVKQPDRSKRFCTQHMPAIAAKRRAAQREYYFRHGVCPRRVHAPHILTRRRILHNFIATYGTPCEERGERCVLVGLRALDPDQQWKRPRCAETIRPSVDLGSNPCGVEGCICCGLPVGERDDLVEVLCEACA